MRFCMLALGVCAALVESSASAHGPQIQVTDTNNKIVTRTLLPHTPYGDALTDPKSVYVLPILKAVSGSPSTDYWTVMPNSVIDPILQSSEFQFGPGLAYGYGHSFADGYHFTVNTLGALQRWNGASFVNDTGAEAVGAFRGDATSSPDQVVISGTSSGTQSLPFSNISSSYDGDSHSSMRFRLLGDGSSALVEPADGLYLLTLQVTSNQPGLASSDPFNLLLYKNAPASSINAAVASLNVSSALVQIVPVPEPSTVALMVCGALSTALCRRRRALGGGR